MSTELGETIIVRESDGMRYFLEQDDWRSMELIGAISADPRTFDELDRAWQRYRPDQSLADLAWSEFTGQCPPGPWMILDLACQRVVSGGGGDLPEDQATFQRDDGALDRSVPLVWINLPPRWERITDCEWPQALPPIPVLAEPLDFRGVLFGRALANGIADRTLEFALGESLPELLFMRDDTSYDAPPNDAERAAGKRWHELAVRVHADWLMTPRDDLERQPPRAWLHRDRSWVECELGNRQLQWSRTGSAPRALDRDTFAYRFGSMGLHEVIMYFDLCRHVTNTALRIVHATPNIDQASLADKLHASGITWLNEAELDGDPTPPAKIIESERRRVPLTSEHGILDCDCPICRMEADGMLGSGPCFACFDGHHLELDDEFAFSLYEDRDEWERVQASQQEWNDRTVAEQAAHETGETPVNPEESVWKNSFISDDAVHDFGHSSLLTTMSLAMRVGELVTDLDADGAHRHLIDRLNNSFDAYRDGVGPNPPEAKVELVNALEQVATALPHLTPKVADLQSQLDEAERTRVP